MRYTQISDSMMHWEREIKNGCARIFLIKSVNFETIYGTFWMEYQILQCIEILSKRQFNWMMDIAIDIFLEEYIVKKPKEIFKRIGLFENSLNISLTFNVLIVWSAQFFPGFEKPELERRTKKSLPWIEHCRYIIQPLNVLVSLDTVKIKLMKM